MNSLRRIDQNIKHAIIPQMDTDGIKTKQHT